MKLLFQMWFNMLRSMLSLASSNAATVQSLEIFKNAMTTLAAKMVEIENTSGMASMKNVTGSADDKKAMRLFLCNITWSITSRVRAYAQTIDDEQLREQMRYSLSQLKKLTSANLGNICKSLLEIVQPLLPGITPSTNITVAEIQNWSSAIESYDAVMNAPRMSVVKRAQLNKSLKALFADTMNFVREVCDPAANYFSDTNNSFYLQYKQARRIITIGLHHTRFFATIQFEIGVAFRYVNVKMVGEKLKFEYLANTDFDGKCDISGIEQDSYMVTVSGKDVQVQTFGPFFIERKSTLQKTLVCQPSFINLPAHQPEAAPETVNKNK